jgi:hypothetical protein
VNKFTVDHPAPHTRKRMRKDGADGTPSTSTNVMHNHTEQAKAPIPVDTMSMSNGPNMKAEAPIPTQTMSMSDGPKIMQNPTNQAEASILTENIGDDPNWNLAVKMRRKAANRTRPFDLPVGELLVTHDEDDPARKKARLEDSLPTTTDEADRNTASPDISGGLPPPAVDNDDVDANAEAMTDTQLNAGVSTRATGSWTLEEDAKLTRAVANTSKKKYGKEYKTDWVAVSELIPGRTNIQCWGRWTVVFNQSIALTTGRKGKWTEDEDIKLNDAVQRHGGKDWVAIATLVPGRTRIQCYYRWHQVLDPSIDWANERMDMWGIDEDSKLKDALQLHGDRDWATISALVPGRTQGQCWSRWKNVLDLNIARATGGKWTSEEDATLKAAVQTYGAKNWDAIAALVSGRTKNQCYYRWQWHDVLDPSIGRGNGRSGTWTGDEDSKLKDAVQTHGGKNWAAITALVPGRTKNQCSHRWHDVLDPSISRGNGRAGGWTVEEVTKLEDAVLTHGDKNWAAISALFPGRTGSQCMNRWHKFLVSKTALTAERTGKWTANEDSKLKDAVQTHGDKEWVAITALFPGRTKEQCNSRWNNFLDPNIDRANVRAGKWSEDEVITLKDAVQTHGGKNWDAIAALVPGRTKRQCIGRWYYALDSSIDHRANIRTGTWAKDEEINLKNAVQTHGSKNWGAVAALVEGRTKKQCKNKWSAERKSNVVADGIIPSRVDRMIGRTGKWAEDEYVKLSARRFVSGSYGKSVYE